MAQDLRAATARIEQETAARVVSLGDSLAAAGAEAESDIGRLRAALDSETERVHQTLAHVQSAIQDVSQQTLALEALQSTAREQLEMRAATLLEAQTQELARRTEQELQAWSERLRPVLESTGQQTIAQLGAQMEQQLAPHLDRAHDTLERLASGTHAAAEALRDHQQGLAKA